MFDMPLACRCHDKLKSLPDTPDETAGYFPIGFPFLPSKLLYAKLFPAVRRLTNGPLNTSGIYWSQRGESIHEDLDENVSYYRARIWSSVFRRCPGSPNLESNRGATTKG